MIELIDNKIEEVAQSIWLIFQKSYKEEAKLLNLENFPPLERSISNIQNSSTDFWGYYKNDVLAGIVEIDASDKLVGVTSLVVSPDEFRTGIANKLISFILNRYKSSSIEVQTALLKIPAITLYKKAGFKEDKRWSTQENIQLVLLLKENAL